MVDEPHAVVKLLVARMESHPEEFKRHGATYGDRWHSIVSDIAEWGNETDNAAMDAALREIRLGEAHEDALDELLNGPERRRKQEEEAKYEQQLIWQQAQKSQRIAAQQYASQYGNAFPQSLGKPLSGKSATHTIMDEYTNLTRNTTSVADALQLGSEKLDESLLKKLKKAAGL